jgi:glycosyltransferase involved in cell wall biosynthesis
MLTSNSMWNVSNFRLPVLEVLQKSGYRVVIVAPVDESVSSEALRGVEKIPLRCLNRDSINVFSNLLLFFEFLRIYRALKPDLVIHYTIKPNIFGNLAAACLSIPSFCVVTGLGYTFLHKGITQWVSSQLYRLSFRFSACVLFENQEDQRLLIKKGLVSSKKTRFVNGCGVDVVHFSPNGVHPQAEKMVFTFIGRLLFDKGLREFVEAAQKTRKKHPEAEFWIVGGFDESNPAHVDRNLLLKWVQQGFVSYKGSTHDIRPFISKSDWIVLPSYREGLSKVLLEAMAMGKPLITTDTAGCREAVRDCETGFLVPVADAQKLSDTFERCCAIDAATRQKMGQKGRERAIQEFESTIIGAQYLQIIHETLTIKH